jgi:hypothetical protein
MKITKQQLNKIIQEELNNVLLEGRDPYCNPAFGGERSYCGPDARMHKMFSKPWFFAVTGYLLQGMFGDDLGLRKLANDMKSHEFNRMSGGALTAEQRHDTRDVREPAVYGGKLTQLDDDEDW